jgi:hypothetical protein
MSQPEEVKRVTLDELPAMVREQILQSQAPYLEYFEAKWAEGPKAIQYDAVLGEKYSLPKPIQELLEVSVPGATFNVQLADGTRIIGQGTDLGGIACFEIDLPTRVPISGQRSHPVEYGEVLLKNMKIYAPEVFWQNELFRLDNHGQVNLVTFIYAFGLSQQQKPTATREERNANNLAARIARIVDAVDERRAKLSND